METNLTNGSTDGVVRIGNTVHRPRTECSPAVESLLIYLEKIGFEFSPRFLGCDAEGRQVLSYIDGDAGTYPAHASVWSDAALSRAGKILRVFHDATTNFGWQEFSTWQHSCPSSIEPEVLCHNDFATYNCIYSGGMPVAMIDFDSCGPASRGWDLAYTAFRFIPIGTPQQQRNFGVPSPVRLEPRLDLLLSAYDFDDIASILSLITLRIQQVRDHAASMARKDDRNARRIREEKHVESYDEALACFRQNFGRERT